MVRKLKPEDMVQSYRVKKLLNQGNSAIAYLAHSQTGEPVFMKTYSLPAPLTPWFKPYLDYQTKLIERIRSSSVNHFAVCPIDMFTTPLGPHKVAKPVYVQVFEFIAEGQDLKDILLGSGASWDRRLIWSKVIMASIDQLHQQRIVHGDLKPENLFLIEAPDIANGYRLKLIDLDYSILADVRAPWHGQEGYVGSPNYFSPEHLRGEIPTEKSDIFTCGLILYEVLAGTHPYRKKGEKEEYFKKLALAHACTRPTLLGSHPGGNDREICETLHRMLSPTANHRPTAREVLAVLNRKIKDGSTISKLPQPSLFPSGAALSLEFEGGHRLQMNITTLVNHRVVRGVGADATYWDNTEQFSLERRTDGWYIVPNRNAVNDTMVNNEGLLEPRRLHPDDQVGVGSAKKGIVKTPARVRFGKS